LHVVPIIHDTHRSPDDLRLERFADTNPEIHPINSITVIEFKRPGRDDYTERDNPLAQSFKLIEEIRAAEFQIKGRPVPVEHLLHLRSSRRRSGAC